MDRMTCDCNIIHQDIVNNAKENMLNQQQIDSLASIFKILGDPTRVKIVWALDRREMCVCDISVTLEMTKSAVSHQLKTLRDANIVKARREGRNVFYSLDDEHVTDIVEIAKAHIGHVH